MNCVLNNRFRLSYLKARDCHVSPGRKNDNKEHSKPRLPAIMEKTGSDFDGKRCEKANEACKESDWTSLLFFFLFSTFVNLCK